MDFLTMTDFFDGLDFMFSGDVPFQRGEPVAKLFPDYFGIQYNHAGRFFFSADHGPREIFEGPHAFVTCPGHYYEYGPLPGESRHHAFFCFKGPRAFSFFERNLIPHGMRPVKIIRSEQFYSVFTEICSLLKKPGGIVPRAVLLTEDLLLQLHEQPAGRLKINAFCASQLENLRQAITREPWKNWDFEAEAGRMSVSYSHFRRIFREYAFCAPNRFLIEARLDFAAHLLTESVLPMHEVAHRSGFKDEFYFSRIFRHYRHCTPSGYRRDFRT